MWDNGITHQRTEELLFASRISDWIFLGNSKDCAVNFHRSLFCLRYKFALVFYYCASSKTEKNTWNPVLPNWCCWPFFPTVRRALFLVHACPVLTSWLGKNRIMDSLKRFFLPKKILKFKKCWEKIGLWIPLFDFFSNKKLKIKKKKRCFFKESLKRFFSNKQIWKFKKG